MEMSVTALCEYQLGKEYLGENPMNEVKNSNG